MHVAGTSVQMAHLSPRTPIENLLFISMNKGQRREHEGEDTAAVLRGAVRNNTDHPTTISGGPNDTAVMNAFMNGSAVRCS